MNGVKIFAISGSTPEESGLNADGERKSIAGSPSRSIRGNWSTPWPVKSATWNRPRPDRDDTADVGVNAASVVHDPCERTIPPWAPLARWPTRHR